MKTPLLALLLLPLLVTGCDRSSSEVLRLREDTQRQLDAKDKAIEDLTHKLADLGQEARKPGIDADALADQVARRVSQDTGPQLAELKKRLDDLQQALSQGRVASGSDAPPPTSPGGFGAANVRPPENRAPASAPAHDGPPADPGKKRMKFDNF